MAHNTTLLQTYNIDVEHFDFIVKSCSVALSLILGLFFIGCLYDS